MKKNTKIFSVLLTVCFIFGILAIFASAAAPSSTTNLGFSYDFESDAAGKDYHGTFASGTGSAGSYSTVKVVDSGLGNKYVRYAYSAAAGEKGYRRDLLIGNYATSNSDKLTHISDYAYYTVDFDVAADAYTVFVGYKVQRGFTTSDVTAKDVTVTVDGVDYTASHNSTRTYTYTVKKLYKTYETIDDARIAADIESTHTAFIKELTNYHAKIVLGQEYIVTASNSDGSPKTVRLYKHTSSDISKDSTVTEILTSKNYAAAGEGGALVPVVTLAMAKESKRLSYSNDSYFSIDNRPVSGTTALNKTSGYTCLGARFHYNTSDGLWHIYINRGTTVSSNGNFADSGYVLSNNIEEWNHFTYVVKPILKTVTKDSKTYETYGYSEVQLYYNGYLLDTSYICTSSSWNYKCDDVVPRAIDWEIPEYISEYSMALDNFEVTYYEKGYATDSDTIGIDDLFDNESGVDSIVQCEDAIYNKDYVAPAPNVYAEVGDQKIYAPAAVKYAIEELEAGESVTTPFNIYDITPPAWTSFAIKCGSNIEVTLSDEAIAKGATITKTSTGYAVGAGIKANVSLFTDMKFNLYLPKLEGIEITDVAGASLLNGTVSVDGVEMYVITAKQNIQSFDTMNATVTYTLGGKTYQYKASMNTLDYVTRVAKAYDCGTEEATLIYEMISYKEEIARLFEAELSEGASKLLSDFKELYELHADCACTATAASVSPAEKAVNYSALIAKGVKSVAYKLSLGEIGMIINVEEGVTVDEVSYRNPLGAIISHTVENGKLIKKNGYYLVEGVSAAYIDEIMTIKVDGASGTYCLGKYIENNPDVTIAKNLYKYAVAAENYKTVTIDELTLSVEAIKNVDISSEPIYVQGYYVGISDEGAGYTKEILLKDTDSNDLIAVRNIPYGTFPNHGYEKGDLVRIKVTITDLKYVSGNDTTQNKRYLVATEDNPEDIDDTILSRGNRVSYNLDEAVLIEDWNDTIDFFKVSKLQAYTYVHFKGTMYMNTYNSAGDGVILYRPHFNASATGLSGIKPDGTRAVGLRANMLDENLGSTWSDYFGKYIGSTKYPGTQMEVDFYAVYTATNKYNFQITILESNWLKGDEEAVVIETNQDIVTEVAYAYYRQQGQIHYDQGLRNSDPSPEDATAQHMLYLDCSSYVNAVYQEAFGVNVMDVPRTTMSPNTNNYTIYAKDNLGTLSDVIGYWENANYTTEESRAELLASIRDSLEVGDVIVYRRGSSVAKQSGGHTLLYIGDGLFLHSIGNQYIYDKNEPANSTDYASKAEVSVGTVQLLDANQLFSSSGGRYLFLSNVVTISLLRPLNRDLTPTEKTVNRCNIPGVNTEKTVSVGISNSASIGETITYTLNIQNHFANEHTNVIFKEVLADGVTFVSGTSGLTLDGNTLTMALDIHAKESFSITWTVKVNESAKAGDVIQNETSLGGVDIYNDMLVTVSGYSDAELASVAAIAKEYAAGGKSFSDPIELVKSAYKAALGRDLFDYATAAAIMEELYSTANLNTDSALNSMIVPNMFGGTASGGRSLSDARVRRMYESNLQVGDIIVCLWKSNLRVFIYVGDGQLVMADTLTNSATLLENGNEDFVVEGSTYYLKSLLGTIVAYEKFVVIRPAMDVK